MKRQILLSLLFISLFTSASAEQKGVLTTTVIDLISGDGVTGAVISLMPNDKSFKARYQTSGVDGNVTLNAVDYGEYNLTVMFLGYDTISRKVTIDKPLTIVERIGLEEQSHMIQEVQIKAQAMRTSVKGDTIVYNADAFKVSADSDTDGLLKKMPGITIVDGIIEVQGEEVKKILVDGKEFFGDDVQTAVKNLPAAVVSKIEVYNKLSDQSEFTGIDDGEGYKAINIVTRPGKNQGTFGKINTEYGFDDKYYLGGNVNFFTPDHRLSVLGMANNINIQNFNFEDILDATGGGGRGSRGRGGRNSNPMMVGSQNGITEVGALGFNYTGILSEKVNLNASYFFNISDNNNIQDIDRQYFESEGAQRLYQSLKSSNANNINHKFNAKLDYNIDDNHTIMLRPNVSFQENNSLYDEVIFNSEKITGTTNPLTQLSDMNDLDRSGYSIGNALIYRAKLGTPGRTITLNLNGSISNNESVNYSSSEIFLPANPTVADSTLRQNILSASDSYKIGASATYTEPLTSTSQLSMSYRYSYNYSDKDKKAYKWLEEMNVFDTELDDELSNVYNSGYTTHRIGPGYNYGKDGKVIVANVSYQRSALANMQDIPIIEMPSSKYTFNNITYFGMLNLPFDKSNSLRVFLRSSTENPSITELQDVLDISNIQYTSSGNPNLTPSYKHSLRMSYNRSNVARGQTLMFSLGGDFTQNSISDSTVVLLGQNDSFTLPNGGQLAPFGEYNTYLNMDGKWSSYAMASFGTPIGLISSNLNIYTKATIGSTPNIINGEINKTTSQYYSVGATVGSNISENVDFTVGYSNNYGINKYSITTGNGGDSEYFTQKIHGEIKAVVWSGFTFTANATYNKVNNITIEDRENYLISNAFIGKKVFKNKLGEIMFGVYDIFDQNTSYVNNLTNLYTEIERNTTLGRYLSVKFVYSIRSFTGNIPKSKVSESKGSRGGMPSSGMRGGSGSMH